MHRLVLPLLIALSGVSCYRVRIATIASPDVPLRGSQLIYENDTLRVAYNFWTSRGQMNFSIYNKLGLPVYVDWKVSNFIYKGAANPYWNDLTTTKSRGAASSAYGVTYGSSTGVSSKNERIVSIAPRSVVSVNKTYKLMPYGTELKTGKADSVMFTQDATPLVFRNYLLLSTDESFQRQFAVDHAFYIEKVIYTDVLKSSSVQNKFYIANGDTHEN